MAGKILITGGAGFIGSHLCDKFLEQGHEVICLDNLMSGTRDNLAHLEGRPQFTFLQHDVSKPLTTFDFRLDAILHFASLASPNPDSPVSYMRYPVETVLTNVMGAHHMLQLAEENECQIILASTAEIYGDPEIHPQAEEYVGHVSPVGVRSSYDEGKRAMEALSFAHMRARSAKVKVVRIFNTYGPRMRLDDGRIVPNLLNSLVNKVPFAIHGTGETTRSFAYVDDIVEGIYRVFTTDAMLGNVVNLGNPEEYTLTEAVALFEKISGAVLEKIPKPAPPEDPVRRSPDITKAKSMLDWTPSVDFPTGLAKTIESYRHKS